MDKIILGGIYDVRLFKRVSILRKQVFLRQVCCLGQQESSYYQAKMQRNFIQMERQRCSEQKNVS